MPDHRNGLLRPSKFLEDFFAVNFEDELTIVHKQRANVTNIKRSTTVMNAIKNTVKKYNNAKNVCEKLLPYNKAIIN